MTDLSLGPCLTCTSITTVTCVHGARTENSLLRLSKQHTTCCLATGHLQQRWSAYVYEYVLKRSGARG